MFQGLRANIAPVTSSISVSMKPSEADRDARQDPFDVGGHAENARAIGFVGQAKARYLDRTLDRHVLQELAATPYAVCSNRL